MESADRALAISDFSAYAAAGLDVSLCPGPGEAAAACPLLQGQPCSLVDAADVVLHALGGNPFAPDILAALCQRPIGVPVVAMVDPLEPRALPDECEALVATASVPGQIRVLRRAALRHRAAVGL